MSIIISKNGANAVKVEKSEFEKEDYLQQYIYENPESIPLYEIKEDIRLLILAREFPTNSGPIDAIGVDKYGDLYVVETKLFRNADKRTVVAQALDYGAALWKHARDFNEFTAILNNSTQKYFKLGLNEKIEEFFGITPDETAELLETVKRNLDDGVLRFVVLMDKMDDRLRDLILYVNQNSQFDIYAVEFEYYKHDTFEIIIPKIFGTEVKKDISVSSSSSRRTWNETELLAQAKELLAPGVFANFKKIYDYSKTNASEVRLGSGAKCSFSPIFPSISNRSLFSLYTSGRMGINFHWIVHPDGGNREQVQSFKEKLEHVGFDIPANYTEVRPGYDPEVWSPDTDKFLEILRSENNAKPARGDQ